MQKTKKILIVDDEEGFLALLKNALELRGFEVVTAVNAIEAGMEMSSKLPALILMDIRMDGIDGFQACEAIMRNPVTKGIPIMIVSALSDEADIKKARKMGIDNYFVKPVDVEKLIARIKDLVK